MVLTGILGTAMGLNNTATFMSSCVAFVAVSMWMDSRISRRKRDAARESAQEAAREPAQEAEDGVRRSGPGLAFDADSPKRDGHGS